jgi:hypothetical protein
MVNAGLFHNTVSHMPDPYLAVYRDISFGDRAIPYIMISLAAPYKITAMIAQNLPDFLFVFSHQDLSA